MTLQSNLTVAPNGRVVIPAAMRAALGLEGGGRVVARLVDVYPDGRALILTDGILRARYRNSFSQIELLEPATIYELHIDLVATANVFKAGHCIRLEVSSSNFPRFDRNSNTGGSIAQETEAESVIAINWIFHDNERPSYLSLPIIERD